MPIVALDTETTGFGHVGKPPREDGVIEVGLAWTERDGTISHWGTTVNPGAHLLENGRAADALRINNIPLEEVLAAPPVSEVAIWVRDVLMNICAENQDSPLVVVAYNAEFDKGFMTGPGWEAADLGSVQWECAMLRAKSMLNVSKWLKLVEAVQRFGVKPLPGMQAHRAAADAISALQVWYAMDVWTPPLPARPVPFR